MVFDHLHVECLLTPGLSQGLGMRARRFGKPLTRRANLLGERLEPSHLFLRKVQRLLSTQEHLRVERRTLAEEPGPAGPLANARRLAKGIAELPGFRLIREPETNIVVFRVPYMGEFLRQSRACDVLIDPIDAQTLRAVTHLDVSAEEIEEALERLRRVRA